MATQDFPKEALKLIEKRSINLIRESIVGSNITELTSYYDLRGMKNTDFAADLTASILEASEAFEQGFEWDEEIKRALKVSLKMGNDPHQAELVIDLPEGEYRTLIRSTWYGGETVPDDKGETKKFDGNKTFNKRVMEDAQRRMSQKLIEKFIKDPEVKALIDKYDEEEL